MVFEKPIIDRAELLRAVDPLQGAANTTLPARLRRERVLSGGITVDFAHASSEGPLSLFCALNRDSVTALRHGDLEKARVITEHAERIEQEVLSPWLKATFKSRASQWLDSVAGEAERPSNWVDALLFGPPDDGEARVVGPAIQASQEIAEVRSRYLGDEPYSRQIVGRIWKIGETFTEISPSEATVEGPFAVFSEEILASGLRLGDPVVVRHEELAHGVSITTLERGLEKSRRVGRISGQPLPIHLDALLRSASLGGQRHFTRPLRRLV